ncbi:hypothetical protein [Streptomyces fradiae]|uniref:hypothetical protein n=1 Tax=Streptomyces fradiae TaxID=1906 RepID=UPI00381FF9B3
MSTEDEGALEQARDDTVAPDHRRRGTRVDVDFPPIENGVDYLQSVVEYLTAEELPGPRSLKYAVLHLQAATEVLLKVRLQREHWSLVFKDPATATRTRFEAGDFESCTIESALTRLKQIAGVSIPDKAGRALSSLAKARNALQHYGLSMSAYAVEARAAEVLDFLMSFVHEQLLPSLNDAEARKIKAEMRPVAPRVREIESFVKARENRLRGALKDRQEHTLECPFCGKWAMVVGDGYNHVICHFCDFMWEDAGQAVLDYGKSRLDGSTPMRDMSSFALSECPQCGKWGLIDENAVVAASQEYLRSLCFACGYTR